MVRDFSSALSRYSRINLRALSISGRFVAFATIAALRGLPGIREIRILSGDRERPPRALAEKLGMDAHDSQVLPEQKAALIERLQQEGRFICFVGDGVNDAIAMKQAQVSASLQGASQLANDTAQIVLMNKGIRHLPRLLDLFAGFKRHMNEPRLVAAEIPGRNVRQDQSAG